MEIINIIENKSIGIISLGMERNEVYKLLGVVGDHDKKHEWIGNFHVGYTNDKVSFIEISNSLKNDNFVLLRGADVFRTEAKLLIKYLSEFGDFLSEDNGYSYSSKSLGMSLWRPIIFEYEMVYDDEYKYMSDERLIEEFSYLCFEAIAVFNSDYLSEWGNWKVEL